MAVNLLQPPSHDPSPVNLSTPTPAPPSAKWKHVHLEADKENALPMLAPPAKKLYTPQRGSKEKLETIFRGLAEVKWTLAEFLYQLF